MATGGISFKPQLIQCLTNIGYNNFTENEYNANIHKTLVKGMHYRINRMLYEEETEWVYDKGDKVIRFIGIKYPHEHDNDMSYFVAKYEKIQTLIDQLFGVDKFSFDYEQATDQDRVLQVMRTLLTKTLDYRLRDINQVRQIFELGDSEELTFIPTESDFDDFAHFVEAENGRQKELSYETTYKAMNFFRPGRNTEYNKSEKIKEMLIYGREYNDPIVKVAGALKPKDPCRNTGLILFKCFRLFDETGFKLLQPGNADHANAPLPLTQKEVEEEERPLREQKAAILDTAMESVLFDVPEEPQELLPKGSHDEPDLLQWAMEESFQEPMEDEEGECQCRHSTGHSSPPQQGTPQNPVNTSSIAFPRLPNNDPATANLANFGQSRAWHQMLRECGDSVTMPTQLPSLAKGSSSQKKTALSSQYKSMPSISPPSKKKSKTSSRGQKAPSPPPQPYISMPNLFSDPTPSQSGEQVEEEPQP